MTIAAIIAAVVVIAVLPLPDFWITQLNYIALYSLVVLGLVLLTGIGGLTSFGQAAFVGIGAYTSAILLEHGRGAMDGEPEYMRQTFRTRVAAPPHVTLLANLDKSYTDGCNKSGVWYRSAVAIAVADKLEKLGYGVDVVTLHQLCGSEAKLLSDFKTCFRMLSKRS
jgi:ABC-type branched-subunit amino acid transport system permease subunit